MHGPNRIGEPIDRKFRISAKATEHDRPYYDEHHGILFLAKDRALPATLAFYRQECAALWAGPRQLEGIDRLRERVTAYQDANPELLKVADVDDGERGDAIVAPNRTAVVPHLRTPGP